MPVPWFVGRRVVEPRARGAGAVHRLDVLLLRLGAQGTLPGDSRRSDDRRAPRASSTTNAQGVLDRIIREKRLTARGVYGFWPANALGDDIVVYKDDARRAEIARFHMLRQQEPIADGRPNRSLADFVAPKESLAPDYIGAFAVTAGIGADDAREGVRGPARRLQRDHRQGAGRPAGRGVRRVPARAGAPGLGLRQATRSCPPTTCIAEKYPRHPAGVRLSGVSGPQRRKRTLFTLLDAPAVGITLTESFAMMPAASVSGLYLSHPQAKYFNVGRIGRDQLEDYAKRKGMTVDEAERWVG